LWYWYWLLWFRKDFDTFAKSVCPIPGSEELGKDCRKSCPCSIGLVGNHGKNFAINLVKLGFLLVHDRVDLGLV